MVKTLLTGESSWIIYPEGRMVKNKKIVEKGKYMISYTDWIESVDTSYAIMRCLRKRVVVGGFSTGAGLALDLAARVADVEGVFVVSPPLKLHDLSSKLVPAMDVWNKIMKKVHFDGV